MSYLRIAALGAVCVLFTVRATAAPGPTTGLRDALHDVWARSPQVLAAAAERDAARARVRAASQPVYNPSLALEGENADVDRRTVAASLPLDLSGKRRARTNEAEAALREAEATYAIRRRDVAAQWLKAWSGLDLAHRQSETGRQRVLLMQRFDALAAKRLAVGDIGTPERDLASLALVEAEIEQVTLVGQEAAARSALESVDAERRAALPALPRDLPPGIDEVSPRTTDERDELVSALAAQDRAQAAVALARRARVPDPTLSLTGGRVRSGTRSDRVIGISVSIALPVLNSGAADTAAAQADADAAFAARKANRWQSDATLRQTEVTYSAARAAAERLRTHRIAPLRERADLLERLWQAGEIGTSDYLVQLKQGLDTALSALALESQAWQAWFNYLVAAGRLGEWIDGNAQDTSP